jgi:hypothetical protein
MIRRLLLLVASVFLSAFVSVAMSTAETIGFETTPSGGMPVDNAALINSYLVGPTTVTFGLDLNDDLTIDTNALFELYGAGDPESGYASSPSGSDDDNSGTGGDWFLRKMGSFGINQSFMAVFSGTLPTDISGGIWDIDAAEVLRISALDAGDSVIATIEADGTDGGDGLPFIFSFQESVPISKVRVTMLTPTALGFDNFTLVPQPALCDFDGLNGCDIDDLNAMLAVGPVAPGVTATGNEQFDLTGDGVIDNSDVSEWRAVAASENGFGSPYKLGDANLDGTVDGLDFILWNGSKFASSLLWDDGDFNGDGFVDGQDFITWNANKFTSSDGVSTVPEPGTVILLIAAIFCLAVARRR